VAKLLYDHNARHGSRDVAEDVCSAGAEADGAADLRRLCSYGGDVNTHNHEGRTPLHVAAAEGQVPNIKLLIDSNADVNRADKRGSTPLQDALVARQDAACAVLLEHSASLGPSFDPAGHLNRAAAENDVTHLARLVRFRCSVNAQDALGRTALHLAASSKRINALTFLLDVEEADVNLEDSFGNTPLDDATREESVEKAVLVALLDARNARVGSHVHKAVAAGTGTVALVAEGAVAAVKDVETLRREETMAAVAQREETLWQANALRTWIREEKEASAAFRVHLDKALAIERERGAVLADDFGEFWGLVYGYAEDFSDWREEAMGSVRTLLDTWQVQAKDYALIAVQRVRAKFGEMLQVAAEDAKPIDRLYEVTFRKPLRLDAR